MRKQNYLTVVTWNIQKRSSSAELVMDHYDWNNQPIICWLSEPPEDLPMTHNNCKFIKPKVATDENNISKHGVFLVSDKIEAGRLGEEHANIRIFATIFRSKRFRFKQLAITGLHLFDKRNYRETQSLLNAKDLISSDGFRDWIGAKYSRQIILGDFNAEPFEPILTAPEIFCSSKDKYLVVEKKKFKQNGIDHTRFFNPCWNLFGSLNPIGTYYYKNDPLNRWKIVDQILLSPDLATHYVDNSINILTKLSESYLLKGRGSLRSSLRPNYWYSDHLPIELKITITKDLFGEYP